MSQKSPIPIVTECAIAPVKQVTVADLKAEALKAVGAITLGDQGIPLESVFNFTNDTEDEQEKLGPKKLIRGFGIAQLNSNDEIHYDLKINATRLEVNSIAPQRSKAFLKLRTRFNKHLLEFINYSLMTNNRLVDATAELENLKTWLVSDLDTIVQSMSELLAPPTVTNDESNWYLAHHHTELKVGKKLTTHYEFNPDYETIRRSLNTKAPEILDTLDKVFAKYKVGEHAPAWEYCSNGGVERLEVC